MSDAQERYVRHALLGHFARSPNSEVHVELGGDCSSIWGHSVTIVDVGKPEIALLSESSTPQNTQAHPGAGAAFEEAALRLIREGAEFYTVLRPTWALPAMLWTREWR